MLWDIEIGLGLIGLFHSSFRFLKLFHSFIWDSFRLVEDLLKTSSGLIDILKTSLRLHNFSHSNVPNERSFTFVVRLFHEIEETFDYISGKYHFVKNIENLKTNEYFEKWLLTVSVSGVIGTFILPPLKSPKLILDLIVFKWK